MSYYTTKKSIWCSIGFATKEIIVKCCNDCTYCIKCNQPLNNLLDTANVSMNDKSGIEKLNVSDTFKQLVITSLYDSELCNHYKNNHNVIDVSSIRIVHVNYSSFLSIMIILEIELINKIS